MATTYYKAVDGITDGMAYHTKDVVFVGTDSIDAHFERTGGHDGDRVLYVKASEKEYKDYRDSLAPNLDGSPSGVVGFDGTGVIGDTQTNAKGEPLKADAGAGKPVEGEPVVEATTTEAQRRLLAAVDGGGGTKTETKTTTKAAAST